MVNFSGCNFGSMMYGGYGFGASIFGWIFMTLMIIALILFIIWMVKQISDKPTIQKNKRK